MKTYIFSAYIGMLLIFGCSSSAIESNNNQDWALSVLPSSIRLDPSSNEVHEQRFNAVESYKPGKENLLEKNCHMEKDLNKS